MDFDNHSAPVPSADPHADNVSQIEVERAANLARSSSTTASGAGRAISASARRVIPENGVVVLPEGVTLDAISVVGRDIVVQLPGGQQIVIVDGAVTMPQLVLGSVQVPSANLAALLIGQEPEPAAGPPRSSGGNFADPVGNIGDPFNLGDLLPPTQLNFPQREGREIIPNRNNNKPSTDIVTPNNPAGAKNATASVNEAGLPARGSESAGSDAASASETTTGTILIEAADGVRSVTLNGVAITTVGQTVTTPLGTLTITSIAPGAIGYSYTLTDNSVVANPRDIFDVVVTDSDGDSAAARLTIDILDDGPTARNDTDGVAAGSFAPQAGNVMTGAGTTSGSAGADTLGADSATVSGVRAGTSGSFSGAGTVVTGQYGTLTIAADGSYTYTRSAGTPGGVSDVFTYRLTDGDGDQSDATLTINIADSPAVITFIPTVGEGTAVSEVGLPPRGDEPAGSDAASTVETTSGTITYVAPDGPATVMIGTTIVTGPGQIISTPTGTLTITSVSPGAIGYTFLLTDNTSGDTASVTFNVTVTDVDGDTATAPLTITIADDVPTARDEAASPAENAPVTINVLANDTRGADGVVLASAVVLGTAPTQGSVFYNGDGTFTYTPNPGAEGSDSFTYTITDGDGDPSTATVTITLAPDSVPTVDVAGDASVDEAGLPARGEEPAGSNADATTEVATGTIAMTTGSDSIASLVINGVDVTSGGSLTTPKGTLVVTNDAGAYSYTYTLTDNTSGDTTTDSFNVVVTDSDGDEASDTLVIAIADDVPTARNDAAAAVEDTAVTINVIANDTRGADGVVLASAVALGAAPTKGSVAYNGDGTFTYTPTPGAEGSDSFTYTITDGDGDPSTATVTITLAPDSVPTVDVAGDASVDEAGLPARGEEPAGSNADANGEVATGTIAVTTGNDSLASLVINGVNVTGGGSVTTLKGTLVVTNDAGAYSYIYTLTDNTLGDTTTDNFTVVVTDSDSDEASDTLVIAIADDVPTARDDANAISAGQYGPATGSVVSNDTPGADGITVTAIAAGATTGTVSSALQGLYGKLTLNGDGSYSYTRDAGTPGGVSDVFNYTVTDGDGDTSPATLTISIADSPTSLNVPTRGSAGTSVDEAGLPAGSDADAASETTAGTITYVAPDGPATVSIDGFAITAVGQTIVGSFGTMTITTIAPGAIGYRYTLTTNTSGDTTFDDFIVNVTDKDGDNTTSTLVIDIVDDVPTARDDADSVAEDAFVEPEGSPQADGNVLTGVGGSDANATDGVSDTQGADGATVTAFAFGAVPGTVGAETGLASDYGNLVLNADGSYTYVLNNFDPRVQGLDSNDTLTEIFTYLITDGDGDTSEKTLTITINGADDGVSITGLTNEGAEEVVFEDDLSDGSSADADALTQTGSFSLSAFDGVTTITVGGQTIFNGAFVPGVSISNAYGTLTVTGFTPTLGGDGEVIGGTVDYSYVLTDNTLLHTGPNDIGLTDSFEVVVTDTDGTSASDFLDVRVIDDVPTAANDAATQPGENAPIVVDVLANDTRGADGVAPATVAVVAGSLSGAGSLSVNAATGEITYTPAAGEVGEVTFDYTIKDGDGDESRATVTITLITDSVPTVTVTDVTVSEAGLADGSANDNSDIGTGSFAITTGSDTLAKLEVQDKTGAWINVTMGGTVAGNDGTLVVTLAGTTYSYTYTLTENDPTHLNAGASGAADTLPGDSFAVRATDNDGSVSTIDTLNVTVQDDAPTLTVSDTPTTVIEGTTVGGMWSLTPGADGVASVLVTFGAAEGTLTLPAGGDVVLTQPTGTLTVRADGTFSFTAASGQDQDTAPAASFTLAAKDADGDPTSDSLTIVIEDGAGPSAGDPITLTVDDQNLSDGSTPGGPDFAQSTISFTTGSDALGGFAFADTSTLAGGLTWDRVSDTLIEGWDGAVGTGTKIVTLALTAPASIAPNTSANATVTLTLVNNYDNHANNLIDDLAALGSIGVTASDHDGESITRNVTIEVSDDLPVITVANEAPSGALTVDETNLLVNATADFSTLFTPDVNADGPGDVAYALSIGAGLTSLIDTASGIAITLEMGSGLGEDPTAIYGKADATIVFIISVDAATGEVTLDQQRAIAHDLDGNSAVAYDDPATLAAGLIQLTATIKDADGDTDDAVASIGNAFVFRDDGLLAIADTNSIVEGAVVTGNVLTDGTPDVFGADGRATTTPAGGVVGVAAGSDTSLVLSSGTGTTIETALGFLTLNADGSYTYDGKPNANTTAGALVDSFIYTIRDGDGDTSTTTLQITVNPVTLVADNDTVTVNEAALDTSIEGSDVAFGTVTGSVGTTSGAETAMGTLAVTGATPLSYTPMDVNTALGRFVLLADGTYTYTLKSPINSGGVAGPNTLNAVASFTYTAQDANGNSVTGTVTIDIVDDVPTARADTDAVSEDGPTVANGNVLTADPVASPDDNLTDGVADTQGADGANVTAFAFGANAGTVGAAAGLAGNYGTLVLNANGSYTYTLNNSLPIVQSLSVGQSLEETFSYTITDGDGDTSPTTLKITINGVDDGVTITGLGGNAEETVFENDLLDGSSPDGSALTQTGSFAVSAVDGLNSVVVGGTTVISNGMLLAGPLKVDTVLGELTITGFTPTLGANGEVIGGTVNYSYLLQDNSLAHAVAGADGGVFDNFNVVVTDVDGSSSNAVLNVEIIDDIPTASPNTNTVTEGATVTGNLLLDATDDVFGADGAAVTLPTGGITGIRAGNDTATPVTDGTTVVNTTLGKLTLNANGSYTYEANSNVITANAVDTFVYTIKDGDGDLSTTTLTITLNAVNGTVSDVDVDVDESGLASGSQIVPNGEFDTNGQITVAGATGTFTYTLTSPADGTYGTLTLNSTTGAYSYTLDTRFDEPDANNGRDVVSGAESFGYSVTDQFGNVIGTGSIAVNITDDVPTAVADGVTTIEGAPNIIGNVLSNDTIGADTPGTLVSVLGNPVAAVGNTVITGSFGSLSISATGAYTYTPNASVPSGAEDSFAYIMRDADGDTSPAVLKFTFSGDVNLPTATNVTASVDDDALAGGIAAGTGDLPDANADGDNNQATFSGNLGFTYGVDGAAAAATNFLFTTANGASVGQETVNFAWNDTTGTLTATIATSPVAGRVGLELFNVVVNQTTGAYTLTLVRNVLHAAGSDENDAALTLNYAVQDSDGSTAPGSLAITFDDDTPVAVSPTAISLLNQAGAPVLALLDPNLLNNYGADGGTPRFAPSLNGANSGLTSGSVPIVYTVSADGLVLTGTAGTTSIFVVTLLPGSNQYSVDMNGVVDSLTTIDFGSGGYDFVGGNTEWNRFAPTGEPLTGTNNDSKDILLTPEIGGLNDGSINTSALAGGVGDGASVGGTEIFRVDFVTDVRGDPGSTGGGDYDNAAKRDHVFDGHYTTNGSTALITATTGATVTVAAYDDPDGNNVVGDGTLDVITRVAISYNGGNLLINVTAAPTTYSIGSNNFTVDGNPNGTVNISNVKDGTTIGTYTANGYNSLEFGWAGGDPTYKIGDFGAIVQSTAPVNFTIPVQVIDGDGDVSASANLAITLNAAPPPIVLDLDGDGAEFVPIAAGVAFDYAGNDNAIQTAWVAPDDALLAIDRNGDGHVNNGSEIVFGGAGQTDLQGLAAQYDSNNDGQLTAADTAFAQFGVWQDANSNGVTDAGEFQTLTEAGITSIGLVSDGKAYTAADGDVVVAGQSTFTRADGSTGIVADVAFATDGETPVLRAANDDQRVLSSASVAGMTGAVAAAGLIATGALETEASAKFAPLGDNGTIDLGRFAASAASQPHKHVQREDASAEQTAWGDHGANDVDASDQATRDFGAMRAEAADAADAPSFEHSAAPLADLLLPTDIVPATFSQLAAFSSLGVPAAAMPQPAEVAKVVADALSSDSEGRPDLDAVLDALAPQDGADFAAIDLGGIANLIADQAQAMAHANQGYATDFGHDLALAQAQLEMTATAHG
jgi:large repetitive protein